jgi:hypothetical protein
MVLPQNLGKIYSMFEIQQLWIIHVILSPKNW